jgi:hypothetical protein
LKFTSANIAFLVLSLVANLKGNAQAKDPETSSPWKRFRKTEIVTGLNFQTSDYKGSKETRRYFELGVARSIHDYGMHGPVSAGVYISEEVYFGDRNIYGTKLGVYTHYLFDLGMAMIYYTDLDRSNLKLRPELGVGLGALRIVGGYNIPTFGNRQFGALRKSNGQLTMQFLVPVKKKRIPSDQRIFRQLFKKT